MNEAPKNGALTLPSVTGHVQRMVLLAKPLHSTGQEYMPRRALLSWNLEIENLGNASPKSAYASQRAVCWQWFTAMTTYSATKRPA